MPRFEPERESFASLLCKLSPDSVADNEAAQIACHNDQSRPSKRMRKSSEQETQTLYDNVCIRPEQRSVGGVLTARMVISIPYPRKHAQIRLADSLSFKCPAFDGCPEWAKPLMFAEHQASYLATK